MADGMNAKTHQPRLRTCRFLPASSSTGRRGRGRVLLPITDPYVIPPRGTVRSACWLLPGADWTPGAARRARVDGVEEVMTGKGLVPPNPRFWPYPPDRRRQLLMATAEQPWLAPPPIRAPRRSAAAVGSTAAATAGGANTLSARCAVVAVPN